MHAARHSAPSTPLLVAGGSLFYPHDVTVGGLTLPREALEAPALRSLRPGDLLAAILRLEGPDGAVEGRIIARLAGLQGNLAEFTFVMLPVRLRRLLDRTLTLGADSAAYGAEPAPRLPDVFALAFAKLEDPLGAERRLILPESAPVYALSHARRYGVFTPPAPALPAAPVRPRPPAPRQRHVEPRVLLLVLAAAVVLMVGGLLIR